MPTNTKQLTFSGCLFLWIILSMNKLGTLRCQEEKKTWTVHLISSQQDCQTLCQTHMPSKQVPMSSACRCMRFAVRLRRTVWPGNLRCQKWFTSSVWTEQHVDTEADTHTYVLCFVFFSVGIRFTCLRTTFSCFRVAFTYASVSC